MQSLHLHDSKWFSHIKKFTLTIIQGVCCCCYHYYSYFIDEIVSSAKSNILPKVTLLQSARAGILPREV